MYNLVTGELAVDKDTLKSEPNGATMPAPEYGIDAFYDMLITQYQTALNWLRRARNKPQRCPHCRKEMQ